MIAANSMIMTVFLWHLTALLVVVLVFDQIGLHPQPDTNGTWWLTRPLWIAAPLVLTAGFVALFGRVERPR